MCFTVGLDRRWQRTSSLSVNKKHAEYQIWRTEIQIEIEMEMEIKIEIDIGIEINILIETCR